MSEGEESNGEPEPLISPPKPLLLDGNLALNWEKWYKNYRVYLSRTNKEDLNEFDRLMLFLRLIGEDAVSKLDEMGLDVNEANSLQLLIARLQNYCQENVSHHKENNFNSGKIYF